VAVVAFFAVEAFDDDFGRVPDESARVLAFGLFGDGAGVWPAAGVATSADARRRPTMDDCTALARREGIHNAMP